LPGPYVVKTDYLMEGKGVLVTPSLDDAVVDAKAKLEHGSIVIEEGMTGPELSLLCVCDGVRAVALSPARDYKRIGTGDLGLMTGGVGAFSPVAGIDVDHIVKTIVQPTLDALRERGIDYRGVLYAGLMLTPEGPKVVEFNVRFGDPEAQVVLPRFDGDLAQFLHDAASGALTTEPAFTDDAAVTVVLCSGNYPSKPYDAWHVIEGLEDAEAMDGVVVFEAGVGRDDAGRRVVTGGRVLNVTGFGPTVAAARDRAYDAAGRISWPGMQYRTDIAQGEA
jgi:phosphoribosylamine--glycine ligase